MNYAALKSRMRIVLGAATLGLGLIAGPLASSGASAIVGGCRSDPYVVLSNGAVIDLSATIADSTSDVKNVEYVLHGPKGTAALLVVPTDGLVGLVEHFQYYGDDASGTYDTYTTVYTGQSGVGVTASSLVVSVLGLTLSAPNVSGTSGQALHVRIKSLL